METQHAMNVLSLKSILLLHAIGRYFIGIGIAGIGLIHFVVPGFRPDILPIPPEATWQIFPYLIGTVFTLAGLAIIANWHTQTVSLSLGLLLLLILLLGHLPIQLTSHPEILAYWTPSVKLLSLAGGLLVLAKTFSGSELPAILKRFNKVMSYGKYLFALQLVIFGIAHFVYAERLQYIVPVWIPARLFWVYVTGIALIGSGLSIFINFKPQLISFLLAIMLFIWFIILHMPSIIQSPFGDGSLTISSLECLACSGIAILIAGLSTRDKLPNNKV